MDIRLYNARILTMEKGSQIIFGELWIDGGKIVRIIEAASVPGEQPTFAQELNLAGNLVLPGFVNAHAHAPMVFLRSLADDLPLLDWLEQQVFPLEAKLTPEDTYHFAKLAMLEYLSSGITASFEMYLFPRAIAQAAQELGFRTVLCGSLNDFTGSIQAMEEDFLFYLAHPLVSYRLGFHAEYTTQPSLISEVAALSQKYSAPVFTHLAESKREVEQCIAKTGKTPTAHLADLGIWEQGGGAFHCIHMTPEDLEIFQKKGLTAVTCPGSNAKLASGIPPLVTMESLGIPIAIGTDGAGSNNALDFFREMYLTTVLQKLAEDNAAALPADQVLRYATVAGAELLGLTNCGTLSPGKQADLVVIDLKQPSMRPLHNLEKNLVYSGSKSNVFLTMVAGRILFREGEYFVGESQEDIYQKVASIVKRLCDKV